MMIAFEVMVNGNKVCVAGLEDLGVLSAILSWANRVPRSDAQTNEEYRTQELTLEVGGLQSARVNQTEQCILWVRKQLKVGDIVTINIKNLDAVDEAESRVFQNSKELVRQAKRRYFEELKKEFGE
jgi:flagellar basal body L-ring protein FlgH